MSLYHRPRLGPGLLGLPRRVPLRPRSGGAWRSATHRAGPLVREADPGEVVVVSLLLLPGSGLRFVESGGERLRAEFAPADPASAFEGAARLSMTLESQGPPRFSHALLTVRAHYAGETDVYLRQRVLLLR